MRLPVAAATVSSACSNDTSTIDAEGWPLPLSFHGMMTSMCIGGRPTGGARVSLPPPCQLFRWRMVRMHAHRRRAGRSEAPTPRSVSFHAVSCMPSGKRR